MGLWQWFTPDNLLIYIKRKHYPYTWSWNQRDSENERERERKRKCKAVKLFCLYRPDHLKPLASYSLWLPPVILLHSSPEPRTPHLCDITSTAKQQARGSPHPVSPGRTLDQRAPRRRLRCRVKEGSRGRTCCGLSWSRPPLTRPSAPHPDPACPSTSEVRARLPDGRDEPQGATCVQWKNRLLGALLCKRCPVWRKAR